MPKLTVNIADRGTPLSNGGTSQVGHMWYTLTDGKGRTYDFGAATGRITGLSHPSWRLARIRFQAEIPKGGSRYQITKGYGQVRLVVIKFVAILFAIDDIKDRVFDVRANLSQVGD